MILSKNIQIVVASVVGRDEDHEHSLFVVEVSSPSMGSSLISFCYYLCSVQVKPSLSALSKVEVRVSEAAPILCPYFLI